MILLGVVSAWPCRIQMFNRKPVVAGRVKDIRPEPGREARMKEANNLHFGKCRIQHFFFLPNLGAQTQSCINFDDSFENDTVKHFLPD